MPATRMKKESTRYSEVKVERRERGECKPELGCWTNAKKD